MAEEEYSARVADMLVDALSDIRDTNIQGDAEDVQLTAMSQQIIEQLQGPSGTEMKGNAFVVDKTDLTNVIVYSTINGETSEIPLKLLRATMRKRLPNMADTPPNMIGKPAFSLREVLNPPLPRYNLQLPCYLNPEAEEREYMTTLGLGGAFCAKSNLASPMQQYLHLKNKHSSAFAMWERQTDIDRQNQSTDRNSELLERLVSVIESQAAATAAIGLQNLSPDVAENPLPAGAEAIASDGEIMAVTAKPKKVKVKKEVGDSKVATEV